MALKIGFIPIEGGDYLSRGAGGGHPRRGARLRLRVDGGAPPGHQSLLALPADRAGRLRHSHVAHDARHRHRRRRLPSSRCAWPRTSRMLDVMSNGRASSSASPSATSPTSSRSTAWISRSAAPGSKSSSRSSKACGRRSTCSSRATYYTLEGRLEPKPVQQPHPPIWIGGWGDSPSSGPPRWPTTGSPDRPPTSSVCSPGKAIPRAAEPRRAGPAPPSGPSRAT